ncbi:MAG TPA: isoprenylcysteine carboxylmethyltransferase family protein [Candidatus Acidoferrales bacterium]
MSLTRVGWRPAVWLVYIVIVFEILFMISPFALYYYSAYAPFLNLIGSSPATAWLDRFFLPHFSHTSSQTLEALSRWNEGIFLAGLILFAIGFAQVYGSKLLRRGQVVSGGLYRWIRHPQYLTVGVMGIGVLLHWPRFLVLVGYVTMLFLYYFLARHEERSCLARYGESYRSYLARTGMFFPRSWFGWVPGWLPERGWQRGLGLAAVYALLLSGALLAGSWLQNYSLQHISSFATADLVVLSPAQLAPGRLEQATKLALADGNVAEALRAEGYGQGEKFLAYVVPIAWRLPDLPMETQQEGGHYTPRQFNPDALKVLFTRVLMYDGNTQGLEIVKHAVKRESIVLVKLDLAKRTVLGREKPPTTVRWGDVPTPYF